MYMTKDSLTIEPLALPFAASLAMPGSKSIANRTIIAACLANGTTHITNATPCDDVALMVENLQKMGFTIKWINQAAGELEVTGGIPTGKKTETLFCENAGTTVRFLTSLACVVPGQWTITGNEHMLTRPIGNLVKTLKELGADIQDTNDCPPLHVKGGTLRGGKAILDASKSSQFLSSLLLIAPVLPDGLEIELLSDLASPSYVNLTERTINLFKGKIERKGKNENTFIVQSTGYTSPGTVAIEGDWSAAGAFIVLSALTGGSIDYTNLDPQSEQGDRMLVDGIKMLREPGDFSLDCTDVPDQVMNLAFYAAYRIGTTTITGAKNLRLKECDRLHVITTELTKAGIDITEQDDGLVIKGKPPIFTGSLILDPHDDHRMAMCFGILGSLHAGITIKNSDCVSKSYPRFFEDLQSLRTNAKPIAITGMRGSGKSNLGRRLAHQLKLSFVDTDAIFVKSHGPIAEYVKKKDWASFRQEEERIIAENLKPGCVIALGGGAIESPVTRALLKKKSTVIWLQMSEKGTVDRLKITKRPPLTDLPLEEEVRMLHEKRDPLYREIATLTLPENIPFSKQLPYVINMLLLPGAKRPVKQHGKRPARQPHRSAAKKPAFSSKPIR